MRSKHILLFTTLLFIGCARSEKLDDDEMLYVKTTIAITHARVASHDSIQLVAKLNSTYSKFGTSKEGYTKQTIGLSSDPERSGIIFRAIADSLNIK